MLDLAPYREQMVQAIMDRHMEQSILRFPDGEPLLRRNELETYRPYAEADVDAIIVALRRA